MTLNAEDPAMLQYKATTIYEPGLGYNKLQSITAIQEFENFSIEEIRIIDYEASGNLFGSRFAIIAGLLCEEPKRKLQPCMFKKLYQWATERDCCEVKLQMTRYPDKSQHTSGMLSVTPIQLFEYSNSHIPSMSQNPSHDMNLSVVKKQQIIPNLKAGNSEGLDIDVAVDKTMYKNYSVEGYQPRRNVSKPSGHQLTKVIADQPIDKQRTSVPKKHHSSQFPLKAKKSKSEEIQMRPRETENKENCKSSSSSASKRHATPDKTEHKRNLASGIRTRSSSTSNIEPVREKEENQRNLKGVAEKRQIQSDFYSKILKTSAASIRNQPAAGKREEYQKLDPRINRSRKH